MGARLIRFKRLKPGWWFVVPKCITNACGWVWHSGQWSASLLKTHDSTGVIRTLCYCKLTRFQCKWNMGRKRVKITSNLDSSYTSLAEVKEIINHFNKELHIWSCRRPRSASRRVTLKKLEFDLKNCFLLLCCGFKHQICSAGKPFS